MIKKISLFLVVVSILMMNCGAISTDSYALVEMSTGRLLKGQNVDKRLPMASTTKIMTGLLACESGKLDKVFTIPEEATRIEGSSIYLAAGEKLTLRELTYGLLLESGNDAATAIACLLEGSVPKFVKRMNERAAELGLKDTHFENPSGLDGKEHYTTALDLARLGAYAMKNEEFKKISSTYKMRIPYKDIKDGRLLVNHNRLLKSYDGTIGIKTGFTKKSGRCLVTCAQRDGVTLVAATLNAPDDWNDHRALLDYGFGELKLRPLCDSYPDIAAKAVGGDADTVKCSYNTDLKAALKSNEISRISFQINMPKFIYAPVSKGQKLGEIIFKLDDIVLAKTDIFAEESVEKVKLSRFKTFWNSLF